MTEKKLTLAAALLAALAGAARASVFTLTVSTTGLGIVTSSNPATGISCGSRCSTTYSTGTLVGGATTYETVTLTATSVSSYVFAGWGGDGCGTNYPTCDLSVGASLNVTALFDPTLTVYVSTSGNGLGVVTSTDGAVDCDAAYECQSGAGYRVSYASNTAVYLVATPYSSSTFVSWAGAAGCVAASTCTVTMSQAQSVTALFTSTGPFTLAVSTSGAGVVTSSDAVTGIDCGGQCSAQFSSGTVIVLTAVPSTGSYFAGWADGGCSGVSTCTVTLSSATQGLGGAQSPAAFFYPTVP